MRLAKTFLLSVPVVVLAMADARDASACGGCFVSQTENTQVTGHRMVLSVSSKSTTLWDQVKYSGNPASFAWVLPTKGVVEVGISSDALFENLQAQTDVQIASPQITCPPPPQCGAEDGAFGSASATTGTGPGGGGGVEVIAHDVVGPYETVQLSSTDPAALETWLTDHGYKVPAEIAPVIAGYVKEAFNFLALKLVPGQGIDSMRPVRITAQGAVPVLPLRMVAAGTGTSTPLSLWVIAEGRYEAANFPSFTIEESELVWNWDTQASNYTELRKAKIDASKGFAWLVQAGEPFGTFQFEQTLTSLAQYDAAGSGYADEMGLNAEQNCKDDMAALFGGIVRENAWVTRLYSELSREALKTDLEVGASSTQTNVPRFFQTVKNIGTPPPCPVFPPCSDGSGSGTSGDGDPAGPVGSSGSGKGCALSPASSGAGGDFALLAGLGLLALGSVRRRKHELVGSNAAFRR